MIGTKQVSLCLQLFDWIYIGEVGAHDGDWEHVTLRLTADAKRVLGIYYSAHRCAFPPGTYQTS